MDNVLMYLFPADRKPKMRCFCVGIQLSILSPSQCGNFLYCWNLPGVSLAACTNAEHEILYTLLVRVTKAGANDRAHDIRGESGGIESEK